MNLTTLKKIERSIEYVLIRLSNGYNFVKNLLVNNFVANAIKEYFEIGMNYPLIMYSDTHNVYVYSWKDGKTEEGLDMTEVTVADKIEYAYNFRPYSKRKRKALLEKINTTINGEIMFRFKGIASIGMNLDISPRDLLQK